jgi:hypothetical protein
MVGVSYTGDAAGALAVLSPPPAPFGNGRAARLKKRIS